MDSDISQNLQLANLKELTDIRNKAGLPSVSAAIAYNGKLKWAGVTGYADLENSRLAALTSRYRLGSTSKALTASLLGRLLDEGSISLEKTVHDYAPELPDKYSEVTVRMLASHSAGVRHYSNIPPLWPPWHPMFSKKHYISVEQGLAIFIDDDLLFEPGTGFKYSTYGYSLLSRVMECATAMDFESLLQKKLFIPAGMSHTGIDNQEAMTERVFFYNTSENKYTAAYPTDSSYKVAGGGIISTPTDLVMLGQLLLNGGFISDRVRQELWTPVKLPDGSLNPQNYGLGWRINESILLFGENNPTIIYHHGGRQNGGAAFFMLVPEYGISVAALANSGSKMARGAVQDLCYELVRKTVPEIKR
jgi:CubicO group peptidase (beta-lactamase class C family)